MSCSTTLACSIIHSRASRSCCGMAAKTRSRTGEANSSHFRVWGSASSSEEGLRQAAQPPQLECPHTMMFSMPRLRTAYSMADVVATNSAVSRYGGTRLAMLRIMKSSPGRVPVMRLGSTRESEQAMKRVWGFCCALSSENRLRCVSKSSFRNFTNPSKSFFNGVLLVIKRDMCSILWHDVVLKGLKLYRKYTSYSLQSVTKNTSSNDCYIYNGEFAWKGKLFRPF